jgi:hypothetical protein
MKRNATMDAPTCYTGTKESWTKIQTAILSEREFNQHSLDSWLFPLIDELVTDAGHEDPQEFYDDLLVSLISSSLTRDGLLIHIEAFYLGYYSKVGYNVRSLADLAECLTTEKKSPNETNRSLKR